MLGEQRQLVGVERTLRGPPACCSALTSLSGEGQGWQQGSHLQSVYILHVWPYAISSAFKVRDSSGSTEPLIPHCPNIHTTYKKACGVESKCNG